MKNKWVYHGNEIKDCDTRELIATCKDVETAKAVACVPELIEIVKSCCKCYVSFDKIVEVFRRMGLT